MRALRLSLFLLPFASTLSAQTTSHEGLDPRLPRLERALQQIIDSASGTVGVAAIHLETGRAVFVNRRERFPMASTYKVPIAVTLLTGVDRGRLRLDSLIAIDSSDLHPGSGTLSDLFVQPGVALSLRNLLELMLLISDNSATDVVMRTAGGPEAVAGRMRELGLTDIRVTRPTIRLIGDFLGTDIRPGTSDETIEAKLSKPHLDSARASFESDPRDTATPEAMATLLAKVWRREILSSAHTDLLLDIMRRCRTGTERLKGYLPMGAAIAHKTGTIGGTTNDIGILTLPGDAGHVIAVVFVKNSPKSTEESEHVIAHIGRAIYDYFLFNTTGT